MADLLCSKSYPQVDSSELTFDFKSFDDLNIEFDSR